MEDLFIVPMVVPMIVFFLVAVSVFIICICLRKRLMRHAQRQFPAPYSQAAYDGGQIMYPLQPPVQPLLPTNYTSPQSAYNPAYVESPKTS